jgi:serine/threonine protein phosphatase 1
MNKTFVIGDIHGAYRALRQCLEKSEFDYENDHLISLGDVCDGWPETKQAVDELMRIKHLTYILGNHDLWAVEWMNTGLAEEVWVKQGGKATLNSYHDGVPHSHIKFFEKALPYYIQDNKLFVHAGIDTHRPIQEQNLNTFLWDRDLAQTALNYYLKESREKLSSFDEIYIGHTPIPFTSPIHACEVWLMDTGAGWSGTLSMMNIASKEIYTSDPVPTLYPGIPGRKKR